MSHPHCAAGQWQVFCVRDHGAQHSSAQGGSGVQGVAIQAQPGEGPLCCGVKPWTIPRPS